MLFWGSIWSSTPARFFVALCQTTVFFLISWFRMFSCVQFSRLLALVPAGGIAMPKAEQDPGLGGHEFTTATHRESAAVLGVGQDEHAGAIVLHDEAKLVLSSLERQGGHLHRMRSLTTTDTCQGFWVTYDHKVRSLTTTEPHIH